MSDPNVHEIKLAKKRLREILADFPKAFVAAQNRVGQQVRTEANRKAREQYIIKAAEINQQAIIQRGSRANMNFVIKWRGRNIPLIKFRTNPKQPPNKQPAVLKAAVKKNGLKPVRGAFVTKVGNGGHVGVFKRAGRRRLPIQEVYGPAIPVMLNNPQLVRHLETFAKEKMDARLDHEINRILTRRTQQ